MKNLLPLLSLSLLSLSSAVSALAAPLTVVVDPAAKKMLDQATAKYRVAKGVRFNLSVTENKKVVSYSVSFQKPNLFRVKTNRSGQTTQLISDGKSSYSIEKTTYTQGNLPGQVKEIWQRHLSNGTGYLMSGMLAGRSPVVEMQDLLKTAPFPNPRLTVNVPPPTVIDGVTARGVKINILGGTTDKPAPATSIYVWFDADGLIRRISTKSASASTPYQSTEQISNQQLNPNFAPETFKFISTGLKPAEQPSADEEQAYYDPRIKVGTVPFAFTSTDLKGQTISPANYKGKVLILDFWATWCGPCVAAFPELKSAYDKYHAQGLEVVGISLDQDKSALDSFIKQRKVAWPQIFDGKGWGSRVAGIYGVKAIPFMVIVGKDGKIAALEPEGKLEATIKTALAAK